MVDATRILDHKGDPISRQILEEQQTESMDSRLGHLHREFAQHPSRGLTPARLASILQEAERGNLREQSELFEDMEEKDAHLFAEISKRKRAITCLDWNIEPPRNASAAETKAAEHIKEIILDMPNFEDVILDMADAIGKGFSCLEYRWALDGKEWIPESIDHRPASWFMTPMDHQDDIRLRDNSGQGEPLQSLGWIKHVHKAKSGYVTRAGLHRVLAWPYLFKNYSVRDLAEFLEIYGLPLRLGKYPSGASDREKTTLLNAVVNIGHAAAGIIPQGMEIEFQEAAKGQSDPYQAMLDWCERSQSKAILGGTLTSQADGKSSTNALGNVHNEVRHDLLIGDAKQIGSTLTRDLVYPLGVLNTSSIDGLRRCPRFVFETREPEDLQIYSEALPKLVEIGMNIPAEWAHDKLNIPQPNGDEPVLGMTTKSSSSKDEPGQAALKAKPSATDAVDDLTAQLEDEAAPITDAMINQVRDKLDEVIASGGDLAEFSDALPELIGEMDIAQLNELMAKAFSSADLAGRDDVNNGD